MILKRRAPFRVKRDPPKTMEEDQDVRLEFVAAVEIDAHRIVRFIQELKEIPTDAWCEVHNVWSKPQQARDEAKPVSSVATTAQMRCERRVADFLCQHFSKQMRHVSQGELLLVRCRRVYTRSLPGATATKKCQSSNTSRLQQQGSVNKAVDVPVKADEMRTPAVSRSTMIDLLDCLGDRIVDVLDAFQAHAVHSDGRSQLTMIGLVQALAQLSKQEWSTNDNPRPPTTTSNAKTHRKDTQEPLTDRLAVQKVRQLLTQLIDHEVISAKPLPSANESPFLPYTDFIACYVAYMNSSASPIAAIHSRSIKISAAKK